MFYSTPFFHDTVIIADVIIYFLAVLIFVVTCTSEWTQSERVCLVILIEYTVSCCVPYLAWTIVVIATTAFIGHH